MSRPPITLSGQLIKVPTRRFIVSKSDLNGNITYANRMFMEISGYSEAELLNNPHNIIRHPDMPKALFAHLWKTLKAGMEFFGYVKNCSAQGHGYWVFAHIVQERDADDNIVGYSSFRRGASDDAIAVLEPMYQKLLQQERAVGPDAAWKQWEQELATQQHDYESLMLALYQKSRGQQQKANR